ncbi:MAG: hypothetical protein ABA06_02800 [Parcubacteria bacterium C7867-001]|nr:MAG: hypothetical protein ABA06_02800 [Parcubacteria bacterium C7867-001]
MNTRRILIIVASIVVGLGVLAAVYFIFFAPSSPTLTTGGENPFGNTGSNDVTGGNTNGNTDTGIISQGAGKKLSARFIQVTAAPVVAGFAAVYVPAPKAGQTATTSTSTPAGTLAPTDDTDIRYIDRASGNVYSYKFHADASTRLSNKTVPGIQTAAWVADGSLAFTQYLSKDDAGDEHIETYALPANGEGGYFLERDLDEVTTSASSTVFSLVKNSSGSIGTTARSDGSNVKTAFSSVLSSLSVRFAGKTFVATTKASSGVPGYSFLVDASGNFSRLLGPLSGLATLPSPSGKSVLFSYTDGGTPRLAVLSVATRTITALPTPTFAEKCVWSPDETNVFCAVPKKISGTLPDDWYQGAVRFADRIWKIDLVSRLAVLTIDPSNVTGTDIDVQNLTLDPKADILVFMNKRDSSLYAFDL